MLILTLALLDMLPVELRQVELIAIRIVEPRELPRLALVDDAVETHAARFERLHRLIERARQFQADRRNALALAGRRGFRGGMNPDRQALAQLHAGPVIPEPVGQFQSERLRVEPDRTVHVRDVNRDVAASEHAYSIAQNLRR